MKIGYYPGCSLHATAREFDESLREVARCLELELQEVEDWSCCGATSAHATNHLLSVALAARNLALAEEQGADAVLAPCAACFNRLASARRSLSLDKALDAQVRGILERPFTNQVAVRNLVDVLQQLAPDIRQRDTGALKGLKVACYYGCLLVRPSEVCSFDDPERPTSMEDVVRAAGGTPVDWNLKLECCGGGFSLSRTESVLRLSRSILEDARQAGAEALVVACPMCHSNLDFRQHAMLKDGEQPIPILFLSELVGLSLGLPAEKLGLQRHFVDALPLVERAQRSARDVAALAAAKAAPKLDAALAQEVL